jgi:hypothetical protein
LDCIIGVQGASVWILSTSNGSLHKDRPMLCASEHLCTKTRPGIMSYLAPKIDERLVYASCMYMNAALEGTVLLAIQSTGNVFSSPRDAHSDEREKFCLESYVDRGG